MRLPEQVSLRVEGLREFFHSRGVDQIDPHITVVAPFNVGAAGWPSLRNRLFEVVGDTAPFRVRLGKAMTFDVSPRVLVLEVEDLEGGLRALRSRLLEGDEIVDHPEREYLPHVTVAESLDPSVVAQLRDLKLGVECSFEIGSLSVLERSDPPSALRWHCCEEPLLGERRVVVRGAYPVSLMTLLCSERAGVRGVDDGPLTSERQGSGAVSGVESLEEDPIVPQGWGADRVDSGVVVTASVRSHEVARAVAQQVATGVYALRHLEVREAEFRRSGIGRALFDHLKEYLLRQGGRYLLSSYGTSLNPFLLSLGFVERTDPVLALLTGPQGTMLKVLSFSIR
jgi:2'-5' RNA ligase/GNAT superfamily N-acetyltransferase